MTLSADHVLPNLTGQTKVELLPTVGRRILRVARVSDLTPRYRRIVLTGEELHADFPFRVFAPSDHVKLFFPDPASGELIVPQIGERGWQYPEGAGEPIFRDYTVRAFDPERRELTVDFVLHDHGVAGVWALHAQPGKQIGQLGPRGNVLFPEDFPRYVAAGDETALPAIARFVEEAPEGSHVTAVIEVADAREQQPLEALRGARAETIWVPRDSAPVNDGDASALETALRSLELPDGRAQQEHAGDERVFVFVAGEAGALKPIRRYLRRELGLPKEHVDVDGYWKRGVTNLDHHSEEPDDEQSS